MKIAIKCPMYLDQLGMEGLKYSTIVVFKVEIRGNDTRDGAKSENLGGQVVMRHTGRKWLLFCIVFFSKLNYLPSI